MNYKEYLTWILDRPEGEAQLYNHDKEIFHEYVNRCYKENIDFVHSLGLKCDCVGWSDGLDLTRPDADKILDKIEAFCKENNWHARGHYGRRFTNLESDWYELLIPGTSYENYHLHKKILSQCDRKMWTYTVTAYKFKNQPLINASRKIFASEKFRKVCIEYNIPGVDFCWVKDKGKFDSMQYFEMFFTHNVTPVAAVPKLQYSEKSSNRGKPDYEHHVGTAIYEKFQMLGGHLPRLNEIFYDLRAYVPVYYPHDKMPVSGFAYIAESESIGENRSDDFWQFNILIHKSTAEILLKEKLIKEKQLIPIPFYTELPDGYSDVDNIPMGRPKKEYFDAMQAEYEKFIKKPRPKRKATDKDALSRMRRTRTENKENFNKKMKKDIAESLTGTAYEPISPYYLVADGGYLSDEYRLLPYLDTIKATDEFIADMAQEELLENKPSGIVVATCADGDQVLLCPDKTVIRFPHDSLEATNDWINLAEFIIDAIETN